MTAVEYRKLTFIAWLLAAAIMVVSWGPKAWLGASWQTDDFMRLVQVKDLLAGQAWNDLAQHRLGPTGTPMHWSRLPDVPIALVTLALTPLLGPDDALAAAALVLPPIYALLFLLPFAVASRLLLGAARSPAALLIAFTGSVSIAMFLPGRIDHHGLQLGLMMIAIALLLIGLARQRWRRAIALAGVPLGLSIWIGAEAAPVIAAWFAALGLIWCRRGGDLAGHAAIAAAIALSACLVALLSSTPPARWTVPACDALSPVPMLGMALAAVGFAALHFIGRRARRPLARLGAAALCGGVVAGAFAVTFPGCLRGYGLGLDPLVAQHWLQHVAEAQSIGAMLKVTPLTALAMLWTPLLGLAYCLYRLARARGRGRDLWTAILALLLCPMLLMLGQVRASTFAQLIALLPLAALITELWQRVPLRQAWLRYAARTAILLTLSAVFWPTVAAMAERRSADERRTAVAGTARPDRCLNRLPVAPLVSVPPGTILSYIDLGPKLLFSTPHIVLASPYHRGNAGLRLTIELFRLSDDAAIRQALREHGIDWIATCPGIEERTAFRTEDGTGLAERLAAGAVPDFLEPVSDPAQPAMRLYRVRR